MRLRDIIATLLLLFVLFLPALAQDGAPPPPPLDTVIVDKIIVDDQDEELYNPSIDLRGYDRGTQFDHFEIEFVCDYGTYVYTTDYHEYLDEQRWFYCDAMPGDEFTGYYRVRIVNNTGISSEWTESNIYEFGDARIFLDIAPSGQSRPADIILKDNYPNPFNPATKIIYELTKAANISIKVYNITGKMVYSVSQENQPVGIHSVRFDGTNLASGTYMYVIRSGTSVLRKKMVLLK